MKFEEEFNKIRNVVKNDIDNLENSIKNLLPDSNPLKKELHEFLTSPAKRLRPLIGFLFLRSIFDKINSKQNDILLAVELIHNATLIHDDVIDEASTRRNIDTLNKRFDNNLAVIAGDFLLSVAMEKVINTGSVETIKICTSALKSTCLGEISQYFDKFKIPTIEDYIEKSKNKTAFLFEIGILSGLKLSDEKITPKIEKMATEFSQNFGIAFQIRDDLINTLGNSLSNQDFESGIYTAPIIFAYQDNPDILKAKNISEKLNVGIEKTKNLMDNYFKKAILAIDTVEENIYKKAIIDLINLLRDNL